MSSRRAVIASAAALFRACLRFYPRRFRAEYGQEMEAMFRRRMARASDDGRRPLMRALLGAFHDVLSGAVAEQVSARRAARGFDMATSPVSRWFGALRGLPLDLKLGARMLVRYPGLTVIGGVAIAFAIAVGIVAFQVVSQFTFPTLPLPGGERIVEIRSVDVAATKQEKRVLHDFLGWQESLRSVELVGAWRDSSRNLVAAPGDARPVTVAEMSAVGFRVASGEALLGRVLVESDERSSAPAVAVIGHEVWRDRFAGDPSVIGRDVQLGNDHVTVVGVMREGFEFPVFHDVWLPLRTDGLDDAPRSGPTITVFARLAPGETVETAQAELTTAGRRAATTQPGTHQHLEPRVRRYVRQSVADDPGDQAVMFSAYVFVALLLVLTCGNVGLLLFARAASRESDLVVRTALGASRGRIVVQMFAEALVLGGAAGVTGIVAADLVLRSWGLVFLETNLGRLPFWFDLSLSWRTFATAMGLTVAGAAIAGVLPAMKVTRGMGRRLKQATAGSGGLQFGGVWTVVIVAQVAATVIFPALVYVEQSQLRRIQEFDVGFASDEYLAVRVERDGPVENEQDAAAATGRRAAAAAILEELRARVAALPGVAGATFAEDLPATNRPQKAIDMGFDQAPIDETSGAMREATVAAVDASYFEVLGAPILTGRGFSLADMHDGSRVAVVDLSFVEQVLQGRNAIGQQVRFRYSGPSVRPWAPVNPADPVEAGEWYEVIGVVPELGLGAPTQEGRAAGFYLPKPADTFDQVFLMVHAREGDPMTLAQAVRDAAVTVDPALRLVHVQRVDEANNDVLWVVGLWLRITVVLSSVTLLLSLAGIYAVLSFTVARRTREIGVRVALGASRPRVICAVFRRPVLQVGLGVAVGTAIIGAAAVMLKYTEFPGAQNDLTVQDVSLIAGYGLGMLGVCLLGCVVPTRRALRIEPTIALRSD